MLVLIGSALQGYANGSLDAIFVSFALLVIGAIGVGVVFPGRGPELRVFLLTYGMCVLVGGLAQCYSLAIFGQPMSTNDANNFFGLLLTEPPYHSLQDLATVWIGDRFLGYGAPLAVVIWQYVYHVFLGLGFLHGPYIGVIFNALVVGLSGSLTVSTARELFGDDRWRLRRVGTLFAFCGIFWLFGAIMIRDCLSLFLNAAVLWGLVRTLNRPTERNLVLSVIITLCSSVCIWYLRKNSIYLFGLFYLLAFLCWYWRGKTGLGHVFATLSLPAVLLLSSAFLYQYFGATIGALLYTSEFYVGAAAQSSLNDSLGMALVVNQPPLIRGTLGSGVLLAFPIPLWAYIKAGATEYELIKTWQGLYKLYVLPLAFAGIWAVLHETFRSKKKMGAHFFIAVYAILMLVAVAGTSLETRHFGQFMPAVLLLAVMPDTRIRADRRRVQSMAFLWIGVLGLVHLAWAGMRFF
ncbi:MAG: hypothetical protein L3K26_07160 [Candidatus Hydrogenedentes bacterium]|nr:hypothetical protein [Candidatus Hydrogenedentota bacterium]